MYNRISFMALIVKIRNICSEINIMGLPRWLSSKESACNVGGASWIPVLGRAPGEGNGNPSQYSYLENPWWATVSGVAKNQTCLSY